MLLARIITALPLLASLALFGAGCTASTPAPPPSTTTDGHGHEHAHDHVHGPHNGEILEVGEEEYHIEWTHTEEGKITLYILDAAIKNEVPIPAEKLEIDTTVGDKTSKFELAAVDRTPDMPLSAKFEIVDKQLLGVLESLSEKVTATLNVAINGKAFVVKFTPAGHEH